MQRQDNETCMKQMWVEGCKYSGIDHPRDSGMPMARFVGCRENNPLRCCTGQCGSSSKTEGKLGMAGQYMTSSRTKSLSQ